MLDDDTLKEAVSFELSRGGQVFFVTNRIQNLFELQTKLERLVPGVRVVIAHGQMPPEQMEKAIIDFSNRDYDVLLSTTIIENGVDTGYSEEEATKILSEKAVTAIADMKMGEASATAWGCDLTYDYVKINADYRS